MIEIELFKQLRKQKGSQAALAAKANVSQQLIGEIESGRTRSTKAIYRIAEALGTAAHILDPDIPSLEGRVAKLIADLKDINPEEAASILDNAERVVELIKKARISKTSLQQGDSKQPDIITADGLVVEAKAQPEQHGKSARSPAGVFITHSRFENAELADQIANMLAEDTSLADEFEELIIEWIEERQSSQSPRGGGGIGRMQKP